ncbi:MAG: dTDP-D-glucose 4,6-dehydratase, dTDP-glucose 4,6-dehydratase [archaeon GW2011_AR17]|nr:MAG: dTDP-D-glucose 4,6-dehydratase, dTDP-glucose 4,6-dehydratase [archaeon GW2011_AR17]MBS3154128.1 dTDP-glucose 4,6-dehydratase [Candidatus Woesearchaeota archaeon]HIH14723.1 dTDP-glucose 4,6-dehydratase [Nanoarchaeota archaeon]HII14402.1 dTDP-glucose 4,6-dehydratase [Nanoarchaeota archaeon]HIJ04975.1 dTDP-glucose 4,6-dehydratase [Nanoarchaeota archaeon]
MKKYLVTGGAGFIGSNFIHYLFRKYPNCHVINLDKLTYAGNLDNLLDVANNPQYKFVHGDIADIDLVKKLLPGIDYIVHFAAESHNDRSILDPSIFLRTNVLGTQMLLEAAKDAHIKRFHQISTCEVFGELELNEERKFQESDPYQPKTPYNASKAAANHVVMSYYHTFQIPVTMSHCCNNYGSYQFPEKLIPLFATNALENKHLPLFRSSAYKREWIHVDDHSEAIDLILENGKIGEAYNIGTGVEKSVEEITSIILSVLAKPDSLKEYVTDRLQHDKRYLLDSSKIIRELGWSPHYDFEKGIQETIKWYKNNESWWRKLK